MPACATTSIIAEYPTIGNLFLPVPDTDLSDFLTEVAEWSRFAPESIMVIDNDLAVFMFLMLRGFLGSLSTKQSRWILHESMSVYAWLQSRELQMPGISTILDNPNVVSHATRKRIFDRQIAKILGQGLEDFKALTIDSTSVKANSKLKQQYRQLLRRGMKALAALNTQFDGFEKDLQLDTLAPSRRALLQRITDQIKTDLSDAGRVIEYASDRVFHDKKQPSTEKVLRLSDGSAAYIIKGSRNPMNCCRSVLIKQRRQEEVEPAA